MNKELIKEIIRMFLENERDNYELISRLPIKKEGKEQCLEIVKNISFLEKHIEDYDECFEKICENLNKKEKKSSKNK